MQSKFCMLEVLPPLILWPRKTRPALFARMRQTIGFFSMVKVDGSARTRSRSERVRPSLLPPTRRHNRRGRVHVGAFARVPALYCFFFAKFAWIPPAQSLPPLLHAYPNGLCVLRPLRSRADPLANADSDQSPRHRPVDAGSEAHGGADDNVNEQ